MEHTSMNRAFSLLETIVALMILFFAVFTILELKSGTWHFIKAVQKSKKTWMSTTLLTTFETNLSAKKEILLPDLLKRNGITDPHIIRSIPPKAHISPHSTTRFFLDENSSLELYSIKVVVDGYSVLLYGIRR
jgi:hypothetical protein